MVNCGAFINCQRIEENHMHLVESIIEQLYESTELYHVAEVDIQADYNGVDYYMFRHSGDEAINIAVHVRVKSKYRDLTIGLQPGGTARSTVIRMILPPVFVLLLSIDHLY